MPGARGVARRGTRASFGARRAGPSGTRRVVRGRAHERMPEDDAVLDDAQEAAVLGLCRALVDSWRRSPRAGGRRRHSPAAASPAAAQAVEPARERSLERRPDARRVLEQAAARSSSGPSPVDISASASGLPAGQRHEPPGHLGAPAPRSSNESALSSAKAAQLDRLDARQIELPVRAATSVPIGPSCSRRIGT